MRVKYDYFEKNYKREDIDLIFKLQELILKHKFGNVYTASRRFRARITSKGSELGPQFYENAEATVLEIVKDFETRFPGEQMEKFRMLRVDREPFNTRNIRWIRK